VVVDLVPEIHKLEMLRVADEFGVSLVNATSTEAAAETAERACIAHGLRLHRSRRPHVLAAGMNPGIVNALAMDVVRAHGIPERITFFEWDGTAPARGMTSPPGVAWSPHEFLLELTDDRVFDMDLSGTMRIRDATAATLPAEALAGIPGALESCPWIPSDAEGLLIGHEECYYVARLLLRPVRYVYASHPAAIAAARSGLPIDPRPLVRDSQGELVGANTVGVSVEYGDRVVVRHMTAENRADGSVSWPHGSNATSWLVGVGLVAAVQSVLDLRYRYEPCVRFTHDLPGHLSRVAVLHPARSWTSVTKASA
jgi:hypothetical protein